MPKKCDSQGNRIDSHITTAGVSRTRASSAGWARDQKSLCIFRCEHAIRSFFGMATELTPSFDLSWAHLPYLKSFSVAQPRTVLGLR